MATQPKRLYVDRKDAQASRIISQKYFGYVTSKKDPRVRCAKVLEDLTVTRARGSVAMVHIYKGAVVRWQGATRVPRR